MLPGGEGADARADPALAPPPLDVVAVVALEVHAVRGAQVLVGVVVGDDVEGLVAAAALPRPVAKEVGEQRAVVDDRPAVEPLREGSLQVRVAVEVVGPVVDRGVVGAAANVLPRGEGADARAGAALGLTVPGVVAVVALEVHAVRGAQVLVGVVVGRQVERGRRHAALRHAAADEVGEQRPVVGQDHLPVGSGERRLQVGIAVEIVGGVVDRRVVGAAGSGGRAHEPGAAGRVAALRLPVPQVVVVVFPDVGAEGGPQVRVLVVVGDDVEGPAAAAALVDALREEVLERFAFIPTRNFLHIGIILKIVIGIKNRLIIPQLILFCRNARNRISIPVVNIAVPINTGHSR